MASNRSERVVLTSEGLFPTTVGSVSLPLISGKITEAKALLCYFEDGTAITRSHHDVSKPHSDQVAGLVDQENAINVFYLDFNQGVF